MKWGALAPVVLVGVCLAGCSGSESSFPKEQASAPPPGYQSHPTDEMLAKMKSAAPPHAKVVKAKEPKTP